MRTFALISLATLAACNAPSAPEWLRTEPVVPADIAADALDTSPVETLDTTPPPPPPVGANTAEEFDTTSAEDRAAALAPVEPAGEERLGTTLATLGNPADPGIWIETGLVTTLTPGRVEVPGTGATINLELRPSGGSADAGSEISLPAMRLLSLPFTAIQELVVYRLPAGTSVSGDDAPEIASAE